MLAKQSTTLSEAVEEYKRRYKRAPPVGFDVWWQFCEENNVKLPDEYDTIMEDLEVFHALSPDVMRARVEELAGDPPMQFARNSFTYEIKDHHASLSGPGKDAARTLTFADFMSILEPLLPDLKYASIFRISCTPTVDTFALASPSICMMAVIK